MLILELFLRFFFTGLFSIGGGLATLPFLEKMGASTGWFNSIELSQIFAISESTPGPIGVNMAVYIGFQQAGFLGSIVAVVGLTLPSVLIIILICKALSKFQKSTLVKNAMIGLKICSVALIFSSLVSLSIGVFYQNNYTEFNYKSILLAIFLTIILLFKPIQKLHPIFLIIFGGIIGIIFF